jgi:L-xylulose reductase
MSEEWIDGGDVWIIGGTSGIGAATARMLQKNHDVSVSGPEVDVRSESALRGYWEEHGGFRYVVYSAGITQLDFNRDVDMLIAADIMDVNAFGFLRLIKIMAGDPADYMRSVVAVSSDAATRPMRTSAAYCASKAALNALVKQAAREHAGEIRVNAVAPGMTAPTGMSDYVDARVPELRKWSMDYAADYERQGIPMERRASPFEIALGIEYLLFSSAYYQTGSIMEINGGR